MPVSKLELGPRLGTVMVRHNELVWGLGALVFIHGLGESRGMFLEAFEDPRFENYNLLAPDLPGHGNSPGGMEFSLSALVQCMETIIRHFGITECVLVGHGLGGDIALWLSQRRLGERIRGIVNVDGTLGEHSLHYPDLAIAAADDPARTYHKWFRQGFAEDIVRVPNMGQEAYRRYHESLLMCRPSAFLTLAREQREKLYTQDGSTIGTRTVLQEGENIHYCLAGKGFNNDYLAFLEQAAIPHLIFREATHWVMIDDPLAFYNFLHGFASKQMPSRSTSERMKAWFMTRFHDWLDKLPAPLQLAEKIRHFLRTRIKQRIR